MRHAVERDAAANDIWIAAQPFAPEILGDKRDIGALLFVRQEIAPANRTYPEDVEVIRRNPAAVELNRISDAGKDKSGETFGGHSRENGLAIAVMHESRGRDCDLLQIRLAPI